MSEPVVAEQKGPLSQLKDNVHQTNDKSLHSLMPGIIIEVTAQKKKKQVISIKDSEDSQPAQEKITRKKERKQVNEGRKAKKLSNRCVLCKQPGKKSQMKACLDCRAFFHQTCLEQEGESVVRYRCRKCRHRRQQGQLFFGKQTEKGNEQKQAGKRLQKEKKKEEQQKKMGEFQDRYPYYFQEDKIKFPIEDKLLFIYRELFEFTETPKPRPMPHSIVPTHLLASLLQIENFFSTFKDELVGYAVVPSGITKNMIFLSMSSSGIDSIFSTFLECLLKIYLSDIFDKNKTDNVRILNEHPFFTLMIHLNDNEQLSQNVILKASPEIIRYLATVPSMKRAFQEISYPKNLNLDEKVDLIVGLIRGLSQIDEFHELVSIKSEKMQLMTKEKTQLVAQLKVDEAQNLSNNQKLKDMAQMQLQLEQAQEGVTRQLTKQLDKHKKKIQKLAFQQTKTEENIRQIRIKIAQIGKVMPFLTSQIQFLGFDRNNSEYFFYVREPNILYVKFRSYLMDNNEYFYIYEGRQMINQLLKSLSTKGIAEKHLYQNISSLIKDQIMKFNVETSMESNLMLQESKYKPILLEEVLSMIKDTQSTFSVYLALKNIQWAAPSIRELYMEQFMMITDLHILKQQMRSLQQNFLFAEYCNPQRQYQSDEEKVQGRQGRKKIPIRIWGINSEKTKKYWIQYLEECIDIIGIWICAYIFKINVEKYVKKKMDTYYSQQALIIKPKMRPRGRPALNRNIQRIEKNQKISGSVNNQFSNQSEPSEDQQQNESEHNARRPNLRKRNLKKMNIVIAKSMQESDLDEYEEEIQDDDQSSNQDCCQICGDYGDMICCDTCPKVYHKDCLKIKDIPQGQWSCYKCLQRLSNERQTRSRVKKIGK